MPLGVLHHATSYLLSILNLGHPTPACYIDSVLRIQILGLHPPYLLGIDVCHPP